MILIRFYCCLLIVLFAFILPELAQLCSTGINEGTVGKDKSLPTSGKFCRANALAMLWSSVQLMASAMASTPRQFAAVNCFSGVDKRRSGGRCREGSKDRQARTEKPKQEGNKDTGRLIKTEKKTIIQTSIKISQTQKATETGEAAAGSADPQPVSAWDYERNKYNNSKQLRGQTTRGIDRSQPGQEVVDGREWDLGLAGPL